METFNISSEDKLNKYLELNPEFAIYTSNPPISTSLTSSRKNNDIDIFKTIGTPTISKAKTSTKTNVNTVKEGNSLISEGKNSISGLERLREISNMKLITENPFNGGISSTKGGLTDLKQELANVESNGGNYKAFNSKGGGEGAVGKYQFRWNIWKDLIAKKTGIKDKNEFMANPKAQEDFFDFYQKSTLEPQLIKVKNEFPDTTYNDIEIMKLLHFQGLKGVRDLLTKGGMDKSTSINMSPLAYLKASKGK